MTPFSQGEWGSRNISGYTGLECRPGQQRTVQNDDFRFVGFFNLFRKNSGFIPNEAKFVPFQIFPSSIFTYPSAIRHYVIWAKTVSWSSPRKVTRRSLLRDGRLLRNDGKKLTTLS
jgi:hypothetical protein